MLKIKHFLHSIFESKPFFLKLTTNPELWNFLLVAPKFNILHIVALMYPVQYIYIYLYFYFFYKKHLKSVLRVAVFRYIQPLKKSGWKKKG